MARKKGTELSVFKGREAKLNRAKFQTLALKGPQTIYDVHKQIQTFGNQRGLRHTKYTNVNRRVKALVELGFLEKIGARKSQSGSQITLYHLTIRANVALLLNHINPDSLVIRADEDTLILELVALAIFYGKNINAF